jgi:RNase P/RNase MRP subunit POP5
MMVVKEKRGRRRYIAFTVSPGLTRDSLIHLLKERSGGLPYVVQCGEGWAIVRCSPKEIDISVSAMNLADPSSVSLRTSGTLATLRDRYPELKRLRPVRRT